MEVLVNRVPLHYGWRWIAQAFYLFRCYPVTWLAISALYMAIFFALAYFAEAGMLLQMFLGPLFAGGVAYAADAAHRGEMPRVRDLFLGCMQVRGPLLLVGGLLLLCTVLTVAVLGLVLGSLLPDAKLGTGMSSSNLLILVVAASIGLLPLAVSYYLAPVLVMLQQCSAWQAMHVSFKACGRNIPAFILFLLSSALLNALVWMPFVVHKALLWPLALGLFVIFPLMLLVGYVIYRDLIIVIQNSPGRVA